MLLPAFNTCLISKIKTQIKTLDRGISDLIAQDQMLCVKAQKLTAISGVGVRTAALLLAQMPELGQLNPREAAALAGLAPFNHDSGSVRGKRAIFGGRPALRSGLIWLHSRLLASIRSCRAFTNVCAPKANRINSLSRQ